MFASGGVFKIGNPQSNKLVLYTANLDRLQIEDNGDIKIINPAASPVNGVNLPGALIFEGNGWNTSEGSRPVQGQIHLWGGYNNPTGGSVEPALVFSLKGTGNGSYSTADGPNVLTERMRLDNYGKLGIGTTTPTAKLHVAGDTLITGDLTKGSGVKYEPEYHGYVLTNDNNYKLLARINGGAGYCASCEFSMAGTTGSTVFHTVGVASSNHSYDGSIATHVTSHYSGTKIKIVSDGNHQFELYVAVNTYSSNNLGISYTIRKVNGNVTMAPSSAAYSSAYLVHTAGNNTVTTSASMPTGSGPSSY
jgi:hypothetical protein